MVINALPVLVVLAYTSRGSGRFQIIQSTNLSTINYEPPDAWDLSTSECRDCPIPPPNVLLNGNGSWTNGTNIPKTNDKDDFAKPGSKQLVHKDKDDGDDNKKEDGKKDGDESADSDDPNFVPMPVSVSFRFTASSFALHALIPTFILPSNAPSNTNISFMLDGIPTGPAFTFTPTHQGNDFKDQAVLQLSGLKNGPHIVMGNLAPGSTFIVSYVNISTPEDFANTSDSPSSETTINVRFVTSDTPSSTPAATSKFPTSALAPIPKKNVTSFAALIGSVVGVLSTISFSIFLSLCYRRRASRKRLSLLRASEEAAEIREFGPHTFEFGPRPFRPRYFPGTTPPPFNPMEEENNIPPPYIPDGRNAVIIAPLPPPPPPPPPPPIHREDMQGREGSNSSLVSITPIASPPISLRRSSITSTISSHYPESGGSAAEGNTSVPALITVSPGAEKTLDSRSSDEDVERRVNSASSMLPLLNRRHRPLQSTEPREDETSDNESGGLLQSAGTLEGHSRQSSLAPSVTNDETDVTIGVAR